MRTWKANFNYDHYIIAILLCGLSALVSCSHPRIHNDNDLTTGNLRGPVKSITESCRSSSDTLNPCKSSFNTLSWRFDFNRQGYITKRVKHTCDDSLHMVYTTIEDSEGRIISSTQLPDDWAWFSRCTIKYDDADPIEMADYNESGNMVLKVKYKYDVRHNKIEEALYNMPGERSNSKTTYKYDNKGNNIERLVANNNDSQIISKTIFTYDSKGYIKDESVIVDDTISSKMTYLYDTLGNRTAVDAYCPGEGEVSYKERYEYKYDAKGNWIYMKQYRDDSLMNICLRDIVYYN
ncbi:MAG: hypothetical protein JWO03_227 [Bacteroidetes bacterium]|nr:hypothetical protein [Bacteroidota bacterium]